MAFVVPRAPLDLDRDLGRLPRRHGCFVHGGAESFPAAGRQQRRYRSLHRSRGRFSRADVCDPGAGRCRSLAESQRHGNHRSHRARSVHRVKPGDSVYVSQAARRAPADP